ncbi:MAG: ABC transporter permease [Elusimicrobiota bacterium]
MINGMFTKVKVVSYDLTVSLGKFAILFGQVISWMRVLPWDVKSITAQMVEVGIKSFPICVMSSFSMGMVLALQAGTSARFVFNEPLYVGTIVAFSLIKELSPVLMATVVAGRVGAGIAAEIGTMKVTEQIDALYTLGTNPIRYLVMPRFIACVTMLPLLTVFTNIVGLTGGYIVSVTNLEIPGTIYWADAYDYMRVKDLFHGLIKSVFFGATIALVSCYKGFECKNGAEGVGRATTSAVVMTLVIILVSDYFLTALLVALGIG